MSLLDAGTAAWFVVAIALLLVQQFGASVTGAGAPREAGTTPENQRALRAARMVLVALVVLLSCAFAWKIVTVFAPILGFELP